MGEEAWHAIRPNLETVNGAEEYWQIVTGPIELSEFSGEDRAYLAAAAKALDFTAEDPWHALTGALKEETGRKGKALFLPLRQALTGMDHGPDMGELLPVIGEEVARRRLERASTQD
jgi:glutamyl-tRNA synthetase